MSKVIIQIRFYKSKTQKYIPLTDVVDFIKYILNIITDKQQIYLL